MTPEEWKHYIDTGEVPYHFFKSMVDLLKQGKKLNQQHIAVYTSHGWFVEELLKIDKS